MSISDFFFQILLFLAGAIIGVIAQLIGNSHRQLRLLLAILAGSFVIAALIWAGYELGLAQLRSQEPMTVELNVSATEDWQATGITVESGDRLTITYVANEWSNCPEYGCPYVDGNGVLERYINAPDSVLKECNHAALISRVGGTIYCVSNYYSDIVSQSGNLSLRINDMVLDDNAGMISVRIQQDP